MLNVTNSNYNNFFKILFNLIILKISKSKPLLYKKIESLFKL